MMIKRLRALWRVLWMPADDLDMVLDIGAWLDRYDRPLAIKKALRMEEKVYRDLQQRRKAARQAESDYWMGEYDE